MLSEAQIQFLNRVCPNVWTEENDIINVNDNVNIERMNLTQIPVQFGRVDGNFDCQYNKLTSLEGCPFIVNGHFTCYSNKLTSLKNGPKEVGNFYSCGRNQLTNLIGAPEICNNDFDCEHNQLTSLEGCPRLIKRYFYFRNNTEYLWGIGRVEGAIFNYTENEINVWIIECMKRYIIFPYFTLDENIDWIKREQKYSCLLDAPQEIREHFSPRILHLADSGAYNESKILNYKTFNRIC